MTDTATLTDTAEVLAAMLTENTGTHMLDSGGAYGRGWQRNAGKTAADFRAAPELSIDTRESDGNTVVEYVTLDVFHFLIDRLDYDADLDAQFHAFATSDEMDREPWYVCLESWLETIGARWQDSPPMVVNTYNGEDSLSQVLQYTMFDHPEDGSPVVALTIHGGCDVRGGYTAPRMFSGGDEYSLFDNDRYTAVLTEPEATPAALAQTVIFPEYPVPVGWRQVAIDFSGGYADRNCEPWDDKSLDAIDFAFGETPVTVADDGSLTIASGPAAGWSLNFYPPYAG